MNSPIQFVMVSDEEENGWEDQKNILKQVMKTSDQQERRYNSIFTLIVERNM